MGLDGFGLVWIGLPRSREGKRFLCWGRTYNFRKRRLTRRSTTKQRRSVYAACQNGELSLPGSRETEKNQSIGVPYFETHLLDYLL